MIIKRYVFLLAILCSSLSLVAQAGDPNQIVGIWKSPSNEFIIKIDKLGDQFQGRIIWIESTGSQAELDKNNPDERLQKIPLKGNKVIKELSFNVSESLWEGGTFYNHKEGKLYNCKITSHNSDQIKITKYVQNHSDGIVETWSRHY